jgi:transposase, IS5 family
MQQWYSLSDPGMEDALIDVQTMPRFPAIILIIDRISVDSKILSFRHLLKRHYLGIRFL